MGFHFRYSSLMVQIFTSMLFGVGVPILFPIVLLNLIVLYTLDRLLVVYMY